MCAVPGLAAGVHTSTAQQDSNSITATGASFTIKPVVTYFPSPAASPGATIRVDTEGLAANSTVTATLGSTVLVTNPAHPSTDANGNMTNLMVTLPSTAKTGDDHDQGCLGEHGDDDGLRVQAEGQVAVPRAVLQGPTSR